MKVLQVMLVLVALAVGIILLLPSGDPPPDVLRDSPDASSAQHTERDRTAAKEEAASDDIDQRPDTESVNDPEIIRAAKRAGTTPECILEAIRQHEDGIEARRECMAMPQQDPEPPLRVNPLFDQYSNEELELLALSEADAAILLARRTQDDGKAREYCEKALVLMGNAKPMQEWIFTREAAGLEWTNSNLNVEKAKEAYEAWLIARAFGGPEYPAENIEQELIKSGIDPTPIQQDADARISELRAQRNAIQKGGE